MIHAKHHSSYYISAIFMSLNDITHYIVHKNFDPGVSGGEKLSKEEVINLVENSGLPVYVWLWGYDQGCFIQGQQVNCNLDYNNNKYLWINAKDPKTKDLRHLIKMEWLKYDI